MFASTTCGFCKNSSSFHLKEMQVQDTNYRLFAVQCTSCDAPASVVEYYYSGVLLKQQEHAIAELTKKVDHLQSTLSQMAYALRR